MKTFLQSIVIFIFVLAIPIKAAQYESITVNNSNNNIVNTNNVLIFNKKLQLSVAPTNSTDLVRLTDLSVYVPNTTTISTSSPLAGGGALSGNLTLTIGQATTSSNGYLSSIDWNTFNNKIGSSGGNIFGTLTISNSISNSQLHLISTGSISNDTILGYPATLPLVLDISSTNESGILIHNSSTASTATAELDFRIFGLPIGSRAGSIASGNFTPRDIVIQSYNTNGMAFLDPDGYEKFSFDVKNGRLGINLNYTNATNNDGFIMNVYSPAHTLDVNGDGYFTSNFVVRGLVTITNMPNASLPTAPVTLSQMNTAIGGSTNGSASISYVNSATNGLMSTILGFNYVTSSITNGLDTVTARNTAIGSATNGLVSSTITNGLASTGYVTGQGYVTSTITNGILASAKAYTDSATNGITGGSFSLRVGPSNYTSSAVLIAGSGISFTPSGGITNTISSTGGAGGGDVFMASNNVYAVGTTQRLSFATVAIGLAVGTNAWGDSNPSQMIYAYATNTASQSWSYNVPWTLEADGLHYLELKNHVNTGPSNYPGFLLWRDNDGTGYFFGGDNYDSFKIGPITSGAPGSVAIGRAKDFQYGFRVLKSGYVTVDTTNSSTALNSGDTPAFYVPFDLSGFRQIVCQPYNGIGGQYVQTGSDFGFQKLFPSLFVSSPNPVTYLSTNTFNFVAISSGGSGNGVLLYNVATSNGQYYGSDYADNFRLAPVTGCPSSNSLYRAIGGTNAVTIYTNGVVTIGDKFTPPNSAVFGVRGNVYVDGTINGATVNTKISGMIMATNKQAMISGNTFLLLASNVFLNNITSITNGFVVPRTGRYKVSSQIFADNTASGNQNALYISVNGAGHAIDNQYAQGAAQQPVLKGMFPLSLSSNDFVSAYVFKGQAGTTNWNYSAGTEAWLYIESE